MGYGYKFMNTIEQYNSFTTINLVSHHGSPGTPDDFNFFYESLKQNFQNGTQIRLNGQNRFLISVPTNKKKRTKAQFNKSEGYQIGYSWGCNNALISGLENSTKTLGIILISPFLFAKKVNPLTRGILKTPFLSPFLLNTFGTNAVRKMLKKSSAPLNIPDNYRANLSTYSTHHVLRESSLEKNIPQSQIVTLLQKLEEKNIPILVLWGDKDQTSKEEEQIAPLRQFKNINIIPLNDAPHALLWTHNNEIAQEVTNFIMLTHGEYPKHTPIGYFPGGDVRNNVFSFLESHNLKFPNRPILSWIDSHEMQNFVNGFKKENQKKIHPSLQKITVNQLYNLVNQTAQGFLNLGIKKGDCALIFLPMSLPLYVSMFALQKIGAVPVFLDSWARLDQLALSADCTKAKIIISVEKAYHYFSDVKEIERILHKVVYGTHQIEGLINLEEMMQTKGKADTCPIKSEDTALITFTTGSSGPPKGADRSHRFLAAQHYALNRHIPYSQIDCDLPVFPIFSLNNLAAGVQTIIPAIDLANPSPLDGAILYFQLEQNKITCTTLSPSLFNALSHFALENKLTLENIRRVVTGGAPISCDDVRRMKECAPHAEILVLYGSTEVEPMAHIEADQMLKFDLKNIDDDLVSDGVNVGHLDYGLEYKFIKIIKNALFINNDEDWKKIEVEESEIGELIVAGEHVCRNYYNNQNAFYLTKIKDHNGIIWHRTGDLGKLDHQNNLWLVGRVHNAICRNNKFLFPVRSEIILKKLPFVKNSAFLGLPDQLLGEKSAAAITLNNPEEVGDPKTISHYKSEIKKIFKKNQIEVDEIYILNEIPMDPRHHSKVEYDRLRKTIISISNEKK